MNSPNSSKRWDKKEFVEKFLKYSNELPGTLGYIKLSKFGIYLELSRFLCAKFPGIIIPEYETRGSKSLAEYLENIWDINRSLLTGAYSENTSRNHHYYTTNQRTTYSSTGQSGVNNSCSISSRDKTGVINAYNGIIEILNGIVKELRDTTLSKPELRNIKAYILSKLQDHINSASMEKKFILENTSWDKLVIGFFGETNAGKSTIIESLRILLRPYQSKPGRGQDGSIVGDGRHDFTKDYHEYSLDVKGKPFVLIDVPGIEGNERIYENRIGEALRKAHIIFYVNGHNKTVDRGTASKIRRYMSDGVTVTALYNVRGNAENYEWPEDRQSLITSQVRTVLNGLDREFRDLIGDKYIKSIPVQGLLAMCAQADFVATRHDLINKQKSLIASFGEDCGNNPYKAREAIIRFSNINALIQTIHKKSTDFKEEIFKANMIKLEAFERKVFHEFMAIINENNHKFFSYQSQVDSFIRLNKSILDDIKSSFRKELTTKLNRILQDLKKDMLDRIEHGDYSGVDRCLEQCENKVKETVKILSDKYQKEIGNDINTRIKHLSNIPGFQTTNCNSFSLAPFKMYLNVDAIRNEDDISFGDVFKTVVGTGGGVGIGVAIGTVLGGPIGALLGGILGGAGGLVSSSVNAGEEQTRRAKQKAVELIEKKSSTFRKFSEETSENFNRVLSNMVYEINNNAASQIYEIRNFNSKIEVAKNNITSELNKIRNHAKQ